MPTEWETVGRLEKLYIFPVKSLAHIEGYYKPDLFSGFSCKTRSFFIAKFLKKRRKFRICQIIKSSKCDVILIIIIIFYHSRLIKTTFKLL